MHKTIGYQKYSCETIEKKKENKYKVSVKSVHRAEFNYQNNKM